MATRRTTEQATVYSITGAHSSLSEDQSGRTRRYLWSMGVRTACFVGAVVATGWLRWALVAGAVVLPYVAVVVANGGRESRKRPGAVTPRPYASSIGPGRAEAPTGQSPGAPGSPGPVR